MEAQAGTGSNSGFPAFVFVDSQSPIPFNNSLLASPWPRFESLNLRSIF